MSAGVRVLALWLSPAMWLTMPALILARGPDALWIGLLAVVAPLLVLAFRVSSGGPGASPLQAWLVHPLSIAMVAALLCANLTLVGDVAMAGGTPRWQAICLAASGLWLLTLSCRASCAAGTLLAIAGAGLGIALVLVARASGSDPVEAWSRIASQPAFQFTASSPMVTEGRGVWARSALGGLVFDEEHRVRVAEPAVLRGRSREEGGAVQREWMLAAGQWVTFRPGDALTPTPGAVMRFEAGKRVPGAPSSGPAWAQGGQADWPWHLGLAATLLGGAVALLPRAGSAGLSRARVAAVAASLLAALGWAQGWAVYGALTAPDLFLGGPTAERMLDLPTLALGRGPLVSALRLLALVGLLAAVLACGAVLRTTIGAMRPGLLGGRSLLWTGTLGAAALASAAPLDPWTWVLLALGLGASTLAPLVILPAPDRQPGAAWAAALVGLAVFLALGVMGLVRGPVEGLLGVACGYPAAVAGPLALMVLWLARR